MALTLGSLFDGISGFPLAARWAGIETKWISEIDPYCLQVSKKNFPNAKQYTDIREIHRPETVDIVSGGFPCQPFSVAGKQEGTSDNRYLWPEMLRVIDEVRPKYIIGENVPGIINLALDEVLASLEDKGYTAEVFNIPACGIQAPHKRERVWILAYPFDSRYRSEKSKIYGESNQEKIGIRKEDSNARMLKRASFIRLSNYKHDSNANIEGLEIRKSKSRNNGKKQSSIERGSWWQSEPGVGRVVNGVSGRLDKNRKHRIKALGNAIVPQIAYIIFEFIKELEKQKP